VSGGLDHHPAASTRGRGPVVAHRAARQTRLAGPATPRAAAAVRQRTPGGSGEGRRQRPPRGTRSRRGNRFFQHGGREKGYQGRCGWRVPVLLGGARTRQHPSSHKGIPATHRRGGWRRKPQLAAARSPARAPSKPPSLRPPAATQAPARLVPPSHGGDTGQGLLCRLLAPDPRPPCQHSVGGGRRQAAATR